MWSTTGVVTGVDGGQLHDAVRVSVPSTTEEGLRVVEVIGSVPAIETSRIG